MRSVHLFTSAIAALASTAAFSATNRVANGAFETTPRAVTSGNFDTFDSASGFVGRTLNSEIEIRNDRVGSAIEGNKFAELDTDNNQNNTISQTISKGVGATYTFSFEYSNRPFDSVANKGTVPVSSSGLDFVIGNVTGSAPAQPTITDDKRHWNLVSSPSWRPAHKRSCRLPGPARPPLWQFAGRRAGHFAKRSARPGTCQLRPDSREPRRGRLHCTSAP